MIFATRRRPIQSDLDILMVISFVSLSPELRELNSTDFLPRGEKLRSEFSSPCHARQSADFRHYAALVIFLLKIQVIIEDRCYFGECVLMQYDEIDELT
jgi:hypothetical protein